MDNHVLVVDDDPQYRQLISDMLDGEVSQLGTAADAGEALRYLEDKDPSIILLDLELPDRDGISLSQDLVRDDRAIIFVSGHNTLDERLRAWQAGAADFIAKPFAMAEFLARLNHCSQFLASKQQLSEKEARSRAMAFASMKEASQYGFITQFLKNLMACQSEEQLAALFFAAADFFQFKASLCFHHQGLRCHGPGGQPVSPIEANIYSLLIHQGRLYPFGSRLMVNDQHLSFLVKDMPTDAVEAGKLRDVVAVLVEGMEAKWRDLHRQDTMRGLVDTLQGSMGDLANTIRQYDQRLEGLITNLNNEIRMSFHLLELNEQQEAFFTNLIDQGADTLRATEGDLRELEVRLKAMLETAQATMVLESQGPAAPVVEDDDVELF
ncbi:response regulator [Gallaecimonas xiamenensis]|uniref:Response regulator receiver protein n=1 Tax=Gallaecimonas xiamenensis 3-C-1 TaxID=745411 RepID=K2J7E8_9GAMM|nr:response regulator [Gallaecimonas xiamenensis]EKE71043.1 response regulator receiver protein [Gallaecimonas xiamenensis 3-C-1]